MEKKLSHHNARQKAFRNQQLTGEWSKDFFLWKGEGVRYEFVPSITEVGVGGWGVGGSVWHTAVVS